MSREQTPSEEAFSEQTPGEHAPCVRRTRRSDDLFVRDQRGLRQTCGAFCAAIRNYRIVCKSLRFRLVLWYGGVLTLALLIAAGGLYKAGKKLFDGRRDTFIDLNVYYLVNIAKNESSGRADATKIMQSWDTLLGTPFYSQSVKKFTMDPPGDEMREDERERMLSYIVYVRIADPQSGATLATSATLKDRPALLRSLEAMPRRNEDSIPFDLPVSSGDRQALRVQTEPLDIGGRPARLQIAVALNGPNERKEHVILVLIVSVATLVTLTMLGGWMMVSRTLQPIGRIVTQARLLDADTLPRQLLAAPQETDSELGQLVATLNDMLTHLHRAFEAQRRYGEAKAQFAAVQQRFVADASHELRTPLTILRGEIELALARPRDAEQYRATLTSAVEEIGRMGRIVNGLTTLARSDAGVLLSRDDFERVDIMDSVYSVVSDFAGLAQQRNVHLNMRHQEAVASAYAVYGNAGQLQQVLYNLVENALKYTPNGGQITVVMAARESPAPQAALRSTTEYIPTGFVSTDSVSTEFVPRDFVSTKSASPESSLPLEEWRRKEVIIEVMDTGVGIAAQDLPHIFERFWRADRSRAAGGSGLGLAICAQIVEGHGGLIEAESRLGEGSIFRVVLPCAADA